MRLLSPHWLLLLPLLFAAGWFWPRLGLFRPLRLFCLGFGVLLLIQPQMRFRSDGLDLWVLVDRSDSAKSLLGTRLAEWEQILDKSKGPKDHLNFVDYAAEAGTRGALLTAGPNATDYEGPTTATRTATAVGYALSQMEADRAARLLVLTDGYSTEPLEGLAERLVRQEVALDYRLATASLAGDVRLAAFTLPRRVLPREAFMLEVVATADSDVTVPVDILRNGEPLARREIVLHKGVGRLRFTDRLAAPGAYRYEARLLPEHDSIPGNNAATQWLQVEGGPRVLLATAYKNDPMAEALKRQGFEVDVVGEPARLNVGMLSAAKAVVLNNVPAYQMPAEFLRALKFYVNEQGGGLAMIGGKYSFAAGGYYGSPIEPMLPVSMELKQEHRKLALPVAIVMDRSGSMGMTAPGTGRKKMELANEGAARAIELLGDSDQATLIAVDSAAHVVAPVSPVGPNRSKLMSIARRIDVEGGGIYVYTGLRKAWEELQMAQVGQRHVILFADANDAEEPGEYIKLLEQMVKEKVSISVIGMGTEKDKDAEFLKDIAKRGNGRIFFEDADGLPAIFAQETVAVARSAFVDEPVPVKGAPGWVEMASTPLQWLPQADGYNLSYLKPGATQAAVSGDEYAAPLLAFWQRGAGRVAAVSFPLGGDFSAKTRAWAQYGDLVQSLSRWLMGEQTPPGLGLRVDMDGSRLNADLYYDDTWNERIAASPPQLLLAAGADGKTVSEAWERLAPGHFRASVDVTGDRWLRGAVRVGNAAFPFGPVNAVVNPEWSFDPARVAELKSLSLRSGGTERVDLSDIWRAPRPAAWRGFDDWWLVALLIALMLEAWWTRVGKWNRRIALG
ncbi:MAG: hypothetical protein JWO94_1629 [Verrucomicrobiaceae bacterium]|nr:hypothetical protein [Verrucomicrobiaceae bacterium]